jgi:hypothetical protein
VAKVVVWASGYANLFGSTAAEIRSLQAGTWSPQSQDFRAAATRSGDVAIGASSLDEMIRQIARRPAGSVDRLGIIAHSNETMIGLSGHIIIANPPDAEFAARGIVDSNELSAKASQISTIRNRFADGASIVLFSCNTGSGMALLIGFQTAFQLDCYGFKDEITHNVTFSGSTIVSRSRLIYPPQNNAALAKNSVWDLSPDTGFFNQC